MPKITSGWLPCDLADRALNCALHRPCPRASALYLEPLSRTQVASYAQEQAGNRSLLE